MPQGRTEADLPPHSFYSLIRFFVRNPIRAPDQIAREARAHLCAVVRHAGEHIPFYREHWRAAGFDWRDFESAPDLARIPFVEKNLIVDADEAVCDARVPAAARQIMQTSGTSGRAIKVQRVLLEMRQTRRSVLRMLWRAGAWPWHRFITYASPWLRDRSGMFIQKFVKTSYLAPASTLDEQIERLREFKPHGIIGQTGGLYLLAREIVRRKLQFPQRWVAPTGTTLVPDMRRALVAAFASDPLDLYGAIEVGPVSWQCRRGNYHIDADRVMVEIVDGNGKRLPDGEFGQVVVTSLFSFTQPFIRYRLLDIGAISRRTCDCGCRFPLMEPVQGRINDFLPTPAGELVTPHFFFHIYDAAGRSPVKEWRIIQEDLHSLLYEYIPEADFDVRVFEHGMQMIRNRFGSQCSLRTQAVSEVPMSPTGKRTCIISNLRPAEVAAFRPWIGEKVEQLVPAEGPP
ncbi:MAG: phenylacetate--CoA ligase family protein [Deltaproteobacteria bacterium]|nr:phenylacetate--CoA ligase family protein [Deltaproteobacteria bacterium]